MEILIKNKIEKYETISDEEFIEKNLEPLKLSEISEELSNFENRRKDLWMNTLLLKINIIF